jgi:hypothetical protein
MGPYRNMTTVDAIKLEKKVGIVIHDKAALFSNGITQNAYFLHQCLTSSGYTCQLLCNEETPGSFKHKELSVKEITVDPRIFDPREYHTIVVVTRWISKEVYKLLKIHKVTVVGMECGNHYMTDQENFARGARDNVVSFLGRMQHIDEQWIIPQYRHSLEYVEIVRRAPAFLVPHLWSPEIIKEFTPIHIGKPEASLVYDMTKRTNPKLNIVVCEPNLNLFKTAWLPIIASEKLHRDHPDLIEYAFVFNIPKHDIVYKMMDTLTLGAKLRKFERKTMSEILHYFNNEANSMPIFVSHQVLNSLNYLYYELLYYGYPLVHNSPDLDGCGYYYPENDIKACCEQILYAQKHHHKNIETYKAKALHYLKRVDPLDKDVKSTFDQMVKASIAKNL